MLPSGILHGQKKLHIWHTLKMLVPTFQNILSRFLATVMFFFSPTEIWLWLPSCKLAALPVLRPSPSLVYLSGLEQVREHPVLQEQLLQLWPALQHGRHHALQAGGVLCTQVEGAVYYN